MRMNCSSKKWRFEMIILSGFCKKHQNVYKKAFSEFFCILLVHRMLKIKNSGINFKKLIFRIHSEVFRIDKMLNEKWRSDIIIFLSHNILFHK